MRGDPDAFAELVRRHRDRLWAVALRTTRRPGGGCRRRAGRAALGVPAGRELPRRRAGLHLAAPDRRQRLPGPDASRQDADRRTHSPTTRTGWARWPTSRPRTDPVEASERRTDVMKALAQLTEEQRVAIVLVDMEGYCVDEVAVMSRLRPRHRQEPLRPRQGPAGPSAGPVPRGTGRLRATSKALGPPRHRGLRTSRRRQPRPHSSSAVDTGSQQ